MNRVETNVFDGLLYYLSHTGKLSWGNFKEAIRCLTRDNPSFKQSTYLISLARLGHLDFDPMLLSYVNIAPAVLVETAMENQYVLVGSRVPSFLADVKECVSRNSGKFLLIPEKYAPTTVVLSELTEKALASLENLGIHISFEFSEKLSRILPRPKLMDLQSKPPSVPSLIKKFNLTTLDYEPINDGEHINGLYQVPQHGPDVYILRFGNHERRVPRDWAEWNVLAGTSGLISYEEKSQIWRITNKLRVPIIVDRCATLCSGHPPKVRDNFVCYSNVPVDVAKRLTKSLYQN